MKVLVTGGCGFIGSAAILQWMAAEEGLEVLNLDALTYAGNPENLASLEGNSRYHFVLADLRDAVRTLQVVQDFRPDRVVHFAAESHVDRSIVAPGDFIQTNIVGTYHLLEAARAVGVERFVHVSTDEVFGSLGPTGAFTEVTPYAPNSPYSASKASSDHLVRSYHHTYGLPTVITNCSNNYGPRQFPEKLIPLMILNAMDDKPLPVYGDGQNVRDWIHVDDHVRGVWSVATHGRPGETYCLGGASEKTNLAVVEAICDAVGASRSLIHFVPDRPGHDFRYAIDSSKARSELGWAPSRSFEDGLADTVAWYRANPAWVDRVRSGVYREWMETHYGGRA